MKKFTAFLDAIGANYKIVQYGESYFQNAPEVHYNAVQILLDYQDAKKEADILKYLKKRKGLVVFSKWHNLRGFGFCVAEVADREKHLNYRVYMDESIREYEKETHKLYTAGHPEKVNGLSRDIMEKWRREYLKSLFSVSA